MGTQKSHFAYRLAWDNSFSERIPFLPLHRRDLVSAEEGNKTFVGEGKSRINWKKFEVMGEVVLCIQRSQKTPYSQMHRYDDIQRLILDIKLAGDEEVCTTFPPSYLTASLTSVGTICAQHACRTISRWRNRTQEVRLATLVTSFLSTYPTLPFFLPHIPPAVFSLSYFTYFDEKLERRRRIYFSFTCLYHTVAMPI